MTTVFQCGPILMPTTNDMRFFRIVTSMWLVAVIALFVSAGIGSADSGNAQFQKIKGRFNVPDSQMTWGESTNLVRGDLNAGLAFPAAIKAGIRARKQVIFLSGNSIKAKEPVSLYLRGISGPGGVSTNDGEPTNRIWTFVPSLNERMAISMFAADGTPVSRTQEGLDAGRFPSLNNKSAVNFSWDKYGCQCAVLLPDRDYELYSFNPAKYFSINRTGQYKLVICPRIYIINTNARLKSVELPAIVLDVDVRQD